MFTKKQLAGLLVAFSLFVGTAYAAECAPGNALQEKKAAAVVRTYTTAEKVRTASKVANEAIQRCIQLLSQFKLGSVALFPSAEALAAAAINIVVDRACGEIYRTIQREVVKYDPKGYVTRGQTFDVAAIFGEWLEKKFPNQSTKLIGDVLREADRDMAFGSVISVGEFLKKAGADPKTVAEANRSVDKWVQSYQQPRRVEGSQYAPAGSTGWVNRGSGGNSFWQWNNEDFKGGNQ